jgi:hypothetical protein
MQYHNWWRSMHNWNKQSVGSRAVVEGIQRCFCMDIQRSKRDPTRASTTQN